jgi:hypothetical protein
MEGGGDKGAYQVGVLEGLAKLLPADEVAYDFIVGVSAGALNACIMSQFPQGNETQAAAYMAQIWLSTSVGSILKQWPGSYVQGVLFENSLLDGSGMYPWILNLVPHEPVRNIIVGATNENLGLFQDFNQSIGYPNFAEACLASSAYPGFLPNRQLLNQTYMDGGCIINIDIFKAVEACLDLTDGDESQVIVDSILLSGSNIPEVNASSFTTWSVMERARGISSSDSYLWYLYNAMLAYPEVDFRYTFIPSQPLPSELIPLNFNLKNTEEMLAIGNSDAQKMVNGQSGSTQTLVDEYVSKRSSRIAFARS